jgi:hypothetical protein
MFQFVHVNSYSRQLSKKATHQKWNVQDVLNEVNRVEGCFAKEITNPIPPIHIYGDPIENLQETIEVWANGTKDTRNRKTRKDAVCLLAGVFSAPDGTPAEEWENIKSDAIKWGLEKYGKRLRTVLEHVDEANPNCHFYVVPLPGEAFDTVHEGRTAVKQFIADGGDKKKSNGPYKEAMRSFQDGFYDAVGAPNGMARIGPKKRRLSRDQWRMEQQQAKALAAQQKKADELKADSVAFKELTIAEALEIKESTIESAKIEAEEIKAKTVSEAHGTAKKIREKADLDAKKTHADAFQQGLLEFEQQPIFSKVGVLKSKAAKERDQLKSVLVEKDEEISTLRKSLNVISAEFDEYKITAKKWLSAAKKFFALKPEHDKALDDIDNLKTRINGLEEVLSENDELKRKLDNAKGRIQHLELTVEALTPEPEQLQVKVRRQKESNEMSLGG